jgi:hypothetical protein
MTNTRSVAMSSVFDTSLGHPAIKTFYQLLQITRSCLIVTAGEFHQKKEAWGLFQANLGIESSQKFLIKTHGKLLNNRGREENGKKA